VVTKPEQSKPAAVVPPYLYFAPRFSVAFQQVLRFVFFFWPLYYFSFLSSVFLRYWTTDLQAEKIRTSSKHVKCFKRFF
jgi:hypothetical protein